jgi:hypothetical protein
VQSQTIVEKIEAFKKLFNIQATDATLAARTDVAPRGLTFERLAAARTPAA